jgi:hypothetical protein
VTVVVLFLTGIGLFAANAFAERRYVMAALAVGLGIWIAVTA